MRETKKERQFGLQGIGGTPQKPRSQKVEKNAIRTREGFPTTRCIVPERSALDH